VAVVMPVIVVVMLVLDVVISVACMIFAMILVVVVVVMAVKSLRHRGIHISLLFVLFGRRWIDVSFVLRVMVVVEDGLRR
jgi:hypothetical protein